MLLRKPISAPEFSTQVLLPSSTVDQVRKTYWGYSEYARFRTQLTTFCGYESITTKPVNYRCTLVEAETWHAREKAHAAQTLREYLHRPIAQHVYDALILLIIDIGEREFLLTNVYGYIAAGDVSLAAHVWPQLCNQNPYWKAAALQRRAIETMLVRTGRIGAAFAG